MKTKLALFSVVMPGLMLAAASTPMLAQANDMSPTMANPFSRSNSTERVTNREGLAKTNADKEIDRRVTALNTLTTKINSMTRVSSDQKSSLLSQVQTAITNLTTLKTKIDADTDAATLKTDKQSIISSYRIFALLIPKVSIMAQADAELNLVSQMTANNSTIQAKITSLQTAGKDVSSLQALMSDRQAKITDAQTQAQNAINSLAALTPDGYPGNRPTLLSARDMVKTARQDLRTAYQDVVKINERPL